MVLRWKAVPRAEKYDLEIALDPQFVKVVFRERVATTGYRWNELPAVPHYWRVRGIDAAGKAGDWSEVRVLEAAVGPPVLRAPARGATLPWGRALDLSWEPSAVLEAYVVEIARDPAFGERVLERRTREPRLQLAPPGVGYFYWRVRGIDLLGRDTGPAEIRAFLVELPAPRLVQPAEGTELLLADPPAALALAWEPVGAAKEYRVEVEGPDGATASASSAAATLSWTPTRPGRHGWRVRAEDGPSVAGLWSPHASFQIAIAAPAPASPAHQARMSARKPDLDVELSWAASPGAESYTAEVARDEAFASLASARKAPGLSWRVERLLAGEYLWRVTAQDAAGHLSAPSEVRRFTIATLPPLLAPRAVAPSGTALPSSGPVVLFWEPVPEAAGYEVALASPAQLDGAPLSSTPAAALEIAALPEGDYAWRVRAHDAESVAGLWSETARFFLGLPPSARAEISFDGPPLAADGVSRTQVRVKLFDARGNPVSGAPVRISASAGTVEELAPEGDGYRAWYVAPDAVPDGDGAVLVVTDRGFESTARLPLLAPGRRLRAGARLGWNSTLGALSAPFFGLDLAWRTPLLARRLLVSAQLGYYGERMEVQAAGAALTASADVGRLSLLALYEADLAAELFIYGGAGPSAHLTHVAVGQEARTATVLGAAALLGVSRPLGPGEASAELSYTMSTLDSELARLRVGGLLFSLGWRLELL